MQVAFTKHTNKFKKMLKEKKRKPKEKQRII